MPNNYIDTRKGQRNVRQTTVGWNFQVKWRNDQETWVPLGDLKEFNPVDIAEYATSRGIAEEPAFAQWVSYTLRKRDVIISAVNSRVRKKSHKYGLEIPTSIKDAKRIDAQNSDTMWMDTVNKERRLMLAQPLMSWIRA